MRLGRILLALLAPLVSFTPALRADLATSGNPAPPEALAGLLRAAVPAVAAIAVEVGHLNSPHAPRVSVEGWVSSNLVRANAVKSPATQAAIRLLTRQHQRAPLRC